MNDKEFWSYIRKMVGFLVIFLVGLIFLINVTEKERCIKRYTDFQPEYHGIITGCMVHYEDKKIPSEALRIVK